MEAADRGLFCALCRGDILSPSIGERLNSTPGTRAVAGRHEPLPPILEHTVPVDLQNDTLQTRAFIFLLFILSTGK